MARFAALALAVVLAAPMALADDAPAPPPAVPTAADPAKIVEALKGKDKSARAEAVKQAKDVQDDKLIAPLAALLDDEDAAVRQDVIAALAARQPVDARKKAAAALAVH